MRDIWNPWHGCVKCSEGCENCYMYYLDRQRGRDGAVIERTKAGFRYPLSRDRNGAYKIRSGETLRICMTSDFFLEQADAWREEAWNIIWERRDVIFFLLTKRPQRVEKCLPKDWGDGWENVFFNVTCENQKRADERLPYLMELPFRHKGVMAAPFIGAVRLGKYIESGVIEQVVCGGENYDGARPCRFEWVQALHDECRVNDVSFSFIETGTQFIKDGRLYRIPSKAVQSRMAAKAGLNFAGKPMNFRLTDGFGMPLPKEALYVPHFRDHCQSCGSRLICNGCTDCGKCGG